jgi:ABC-2 type transport system ATP-binding protein
LTHYTGTAIDGAVLEALHLTKRYGSVLAVDDVSFEIRRGEILGCLGPNGSGKSTTVQMLVGLLEPDAGAFRLDGVPVSPQDVEFRRQIGYVPEEPYIYTHLTALEYLTLVGRLRGMTRDEVDRKVSRLLLLMALHDSRYAALSDYSKGMRQKVLLAAALLHDPQIVVLDEPFSGLDVSASLLVRTLVHTLAAGGRMVLFSSHRLDIVEKVCSRVVILDRSRAVARDTIANLRDTLASASLEDVFAQVTLQDDYTDVAREILDVVRRG